MSPSESSQLGDSLGAKNLFQIDFFSRSLWVRTQAGGCSPLDSVPCPCIPPGLPALAEESQLRWGFSTPVIEEADFELPHTSEFIKIVSCIFYVMSSVYILFPQIEERAFYGSNST